MTGDRDTLPVYLGPFVSAEDRRASDAMQLVAEGLIAPSDALMNYEHLVDDLHLHGAHEAAVRATGTVYACPDWCDATDHARVGLHDGLVAPGHHTARAEVAGLRVGVAQEDHPGAVASVLLGGDVDLTAAQARQVAAALLNAADALDGIGPLGDSEVQA